MATGPMRAGGFALFALALASQSSALRCGPGSAFSRTARPTTPRAAVTLGESVAGATYSLDNVVLDGPLKPLKDQILVKLTEMEKQTKGGLYLTNSGANKPTKGTVVAAGPGKPHPHTDVLIANPIKAGDRILFGEYAGVKVKYCLDDHVIMSADEVAAVVVDGKVVPVRDRVMLKPIEKPVETSAGIVLTSEAAKAQEVPNQGEVVAKGEGRFTAKGEIEPIPIEIGEKVMYTKYAGTELEIDGEKRVFVFAADCIAKYG